MISLLVKEKMYINEVVLGTAFGVLMGPHVANIFDPRSWGSDDTSQRITLEVMRIVLATGLFAIGVELPQSYLADHAKGLLVMVVPTMAFGWLIVAVIIYVLFIPINFISALAIAACLTPTDPIICAAIVGGKFAIKHVPKNLRLILSAESAANDGLAYPFLSISIYLTLESSRAVAVEKWLVIGWLYQVILGSIIGAVMGLGFSQLMKFSHRKGFIDRESYVSQYLALAVFTIGVASTIGSDDLLAAFAAGSAISWDGYFNVQIENEVFSSVIDLVLNCGCFVYIGAWLPFPAFNSPELGITPWRLVVLFLAILALRRIPALLLLYRWVPEIGDWREALFSGHFGPMGVGAVFVSTLAISKLPKPHDPPQNQQEVLAATLQPIVSFIVLGSILIHGLSIPFFSFGRRIHSRTVSMSRTWTSRTTAVPDWLLGTRRMPETVTEAMPTAPGAGSPSLQGSVTLPDVEAGLSHTAHHVHQAADADVLVEPQEDIERDRSRAPALGEAGMLKPPVERADSLRGLRRRFPSPDATRRSSPARSEHSRRSIPTVEVEPPAPAHVHTSNSEIAAQLPAIAPPDMPPAHHPHHPALSGLLTPPGDAEDGSGPPSGVRTPVKTVRFPSDPAQ
ncbi:Na-H-Exchanger domain-containing protein [Phanerochaete sordida]|uniref:Na-H-Exchanger domain-containing protein n=1 Tax=Phanerochaete sordida TaxID=48140 RepID=A0A9P3GI97_9APHY|nr:Na-H-Exchanger domain-containing protein [Phanerochaete sordida]